MKKALIGAFVCASAVIGLGGPAFAGEITGSGKGGPNGDGIPGGIGKAHSACVFSGLEDEAASPGTVQNWGHVEDDPIFGEIIENTGAAFVVVIVDFGGGPFELHTGCNAHAEAEG
jgi:hypothetical protein